MPLSMDHAADYIIYSGQGFMTQSCFQLKGGMVPMPTLELLYFDTTLFAEELLEKVKQAPMFFQQTPVILSLEKYQAESEPDLAQIISLCTLNGMTLIAARAPEQFADLIEKQQLAYIPAGFKVEKNKDKEPPAAEPIVEVRTVVEEKLISQPTKVIHQPVRSGQQIYAKGGDLIVLSQVSEGAEVLADGNVHIYGALRGRALAGVSGDASARIFCQSMEAELVSINGNFKLHEDLQQGVWHQAAQVYYQDDALHVMPL